VIKSAGPCRAIVTATSISVSLRALGTIVVVSADLVDDHWWLGRALVQKREARGKGLGTLALHHLQDEVGRSHVKVVQVAPGGYFDDNREQQFNFYLKNGFKPVRGQEGLLEWRL
jgi:hypothetical protein